MRAFYNDHFRASATEGQPIEARTMAYNDRLALWEADLDTIVSMARELEDLRSRYDTLELKHLDAQFEIQRCVLARCLALFVRLTARGRFRAVRNGLIGGGTAGR